MKSLLFFIGCFCIVCSLVSCSGETVYAPVTEVSAIEPLPKNSLYYVRRDDTLYSIAWRYGLDYQYLAKINNIAKPYHIEPGQVVNLRPGSVSHGSGTTRHKEESLSVRSSQTRVSSLNNKPLRPLIKEPTGSVSIWHWPAQGPLIESFGGMNKGVNIGGMIGEKITAAAPGIVVYSGNGLRAYGNLIIIKHNSVFLSAYAHNSRVAVHEGDSVKAGQKIAEMGDSGSRCVMLHFEIRKSGKPVNPLNYLSKK